MVFTGTLAQFFPELGADGELPREARVSPGASALGLEGEFRPGHFEGVATIVDRLFDVVGADRAYFGRKDFQQTLVVSELAERRGDPRIVVCPTVREASGLALSSRNARLDAAARERARAIPRALAAARRAWEAGERDPRTLCDGPAGRPRCGGAGRRVRPRCAIPRAGAPHGRRGRSSGPSP